MKRGEAVPLFSKDLIDANGKLVRDPNFPDLPTIEEAYEITHGKKPSGGEWEAFSSFLISGFPAQKPLLLQGGMPEPIVEAYEQAVRKIHPLNQGIAQRKGGVVVEHGFTV